jgi:ketosteroid isomerase-like protein
MMVQLHKIKLPFALSALFFVVASTSCKQKEQKLTVTDFNYELLQQDIAFSTLSLKVGIKNAYLEFADSNAVFLKPNSLPIEDADAIDYIISLDDKDFDFRWEPQRAKVASSGDLGYTYGIYEIKSKVDTNALTGNYVTVWRKQVDGKWKFTLQSSNEGLGN